MFGVARWTVAIITGGLLGIACASTPTPETQVESGPSTSAAGLESEGEAGLPYLTMNGAEFTIDVRVPSDRGGSEGRPVLVLFHGLSAATNDADDVTVIADAAVSNGMVVFAPEWIIDEPFPILRDDVLMLRRAGECAVAFAQQHAPRFGGDPARTITSGFSAGTGPALTAAITPVTGRPLDGCMAEPMADTVVGTVLGDGEYFWQSQAFDEAFAADPAGMLRETALLIEPSGWEADPALRVRLWAAADRTAPRQLNAGTGDGEGTPDVSDWLTDRDADGSIRFDLDVLGALDDGIVDYVDSAALLERRAAIVGFDVELEIYAGGHTTSDKAESITRHLLTVAAES